MVRLPHVSLHPGFAILDAVLLLMPASSRVDAKISHGKGTAISLCISASYSVGPMIQLSFCNLAMLILHLDVEYLVLRALFYPIKV
jgi:hypothetical protein